MNEVQIHIIYSILHKFIKKTATSAKIYTHNVHHDHHYECTANKYLNQK